MASLCLLLCGDSGGGGDAGAAEGEWELNCDRPTTLRSAQLVKAGLLLPAGGSSRDNEDVITIGCSASGRWQITRHSSVSVAVRRWKSRFKIGRRHHVLDVPGATSELSHHDQICFGDAQRAAMRFEVLADIRPAVAPLPEVAPVAAAAEKAEGREELEEAHFFVPDFQRFSQDSNVALSQSSCLQRSSLQHPAATSSTPGSGGDNAEHSDFCGPDSIDLPDSDHEGDLFGSQVNNSQDNLDAAVAVTANAAAAEEWLCLQCETLNAGFLRNCELCRARCSTIGAEQLSPQHTAEPAVVGNDSLAFESPGSPSLSPLPTAEPSKPEEDTVVTVVEAAIQDQQSLATSAAETIDLTVDSPAAVHQDSHDLPQLQLRSQMETQAVRSASEAAAPVFSIFSEQRKRRRQQLAIGYELNEGSNPTALSTGTDNQSRRQPVQDTVRTYPSRLIHDKKQTVTTEPGKGTRATKHTSVAARRAAAAGVIVTRAHTADRLQWSAEAGKVIYQEGKTRAKWSAKEAERQQKQATTRKPGVANHVETRGSMPTGGAKIPPRRKAASDFKAGVSDLPPVTLALDHSVPSRAVAIPVPACTEQGAEWGCDVGASVLNVRWPEALHPSRPQIMLMRHAAAALVTGRHALLESPTGTGKTLALLSVCLATQWARMDTKATRDGTAYHQRVVYVSRTHAQLDQVTKELKRTP